MVCDFQKYKQKITFKEMVDDLEKQVRIKSDPVFGDIRDTPTVSKDVRRSKSQPQPWTKERIFAANVL